MVQQRKKRRRNKKIVQKLILICTLSIALIICSVVGVSIYQKITSGSEQDTQASLNDMSELKKQTQVIEIKVKMHRKKTLGNHQKIIALTFDDGPGYNSTQRILDTLKKYHIKATFFVLGNRVESNPDMLKKIAKAGHQIENHSYSHPDLVNGVSVHEAVQEINATQEAINKVIGKKPKYLRPPYGSYNDAIVQNGGLPIALWSVDSNDWRLKNGPAIYDYTMSTLVNIPVALFHDIYETTADAIELIVPALVKQGYTFLTYDEIMQYRGS